MARRRWGRFGLTLPELLIVVAVLAVMLGVLLPALRHARAAAHRTACLDHLRAIGSAVNRVVSDRGGRFPEARYLDTPFVYPADDPPLTVALIGQLRGPADVFGCPGDAGALYALCGMSYFYHFALSDRLVSQLGATYAFNHTPATMPVLWDCDNVTLPTETGERAIPRFHEVRCALYADGHAGPIEDRRTPLFHQR
jgi:prepilin-type N-terminal cleavage/methylation domain-containing protein